MILKKKKKNLTNGMGTHFGASSQQEVEMEENMELDLTIHPEQVRPWKIATRGWENASLLAG